MLLSFLSHHMTMPHTVDNLEVIININIQRPLIDIVVNRHHHIPVKSDNFTVP